MVELSRAIRKAKNGKSAGDAGWEYYKALMVDSSTKVFLLEVANAHWCSGNFLDNVPC